MSSHDPNSDLSLVQTFLSTARSNALVSTNATLAADITTISNFLADTPTLSTVGTITAGLGIPTAGLYVTAPATFPSAAQFGSHISTTVATVGVVTSCGGASAPTVAVDFIASDFAANIGEQVDLHGSSTYVSGGLAVLSALASGSTSVTIPTLALGDVIEYSSSAIFVSESPAVSLWGADLVSLGSRSASLTAMIGSGISAVTVYDAPPSGQPNASGPHTTINDTGSFARYDFTTAGATLNLTPASGVTVELNNAFFGGTGVTVTDWVSGQDHLSLAHLGWNGISTAIVLSAVGTPLPALNPTAMHAAFLFELGEIGVGDAATVATLASRAYAPGANDSVGIYFAGTTAAGDTEVWAFKGDTHGTVAANDLALAVTLVGVHSLTANDITVA